MGLRENHSLRNMAVTIALAGCIACPQIFGQEKYDDKKKDDMGCASVPMTEIRQKTIDSQHPTKNRIMPLIESDSTGNVDDIITGLLDGLLFTPATKTMNLQCGEDVALDITTFPMKNSYAKIVSKGVSIDKAFQSIYNGINKNYSADKNAVLNKCQVKLNHKELESIIKRFESLDPLWAKYVSDGVIDADEFRNLPKGIYAIEIKSLNNKNKIIESGHMFVTRGNDYTENCGEKEIIIKNMAGSIDGQGSVAKADSVSGRDSVITEPGPWSFGGFAGYELRYWNEKDNFMDFNMNNHGPFIAGFLKYDEKIGARGGIEARYYVPSNGNYRNNKKSEKIGIFTNSELDIDLFLGAATGGENSRAYLGGRYIFENRNPEIAYDITKENPFSLLLESTTDRHVLALESALEFQSQPFSFKIFGNYGILGKEYKTDTGTNFPDSEASEADMNLFTAGANMGIGSFDLLLKLQDRSYNAKKGFTQDKKESIITLEATMDINKPVFVVVGYRNHMTKIDERKFQSAIEKYYAGVGVKF